MGTLILMILLPGWLIILRFWYIESGLSYTRIILCMSLECRGTCIIKALNLFNYILARLADYLNVC